MKLRNGSKMEDAEREMKTDDSIAGFKRIYIDYQGRTIDVLASLEHVFNKYCEKVSGMAEEEGSTSENVLRKADFWSAMKELELDLDAEELHQALRAFKRETITLKELCHWWIE